MVACLLSAQMTMTDTPKVREAGNSSGVILQKRILDEMGVKDARAFMDSHQNAFREIAE